ncbi:hypothetical protein CFBP1590__5042 [Pseudomonas viridiflava]|uniref:Uncharacterized protein n=1 Tax=Pseudomonas viridiflava TaxID=33069 RepID=A0A1Y6JRQ9_PSEVI|nr:hypothetical protein [Pseudomonas viridiflava]SMS12628.1 hypothetical protein CFBP1590__5042 [Pseudomonas viridiflava]
MGFWDKAGELALKAGTFAVKEVKAAGDRSREYKELMPTLSDDELLRIVKKERSSSPMKAGAAHGELKNRGYDPESIKQLAS